MPSRRSRWPSSSGWRGPPAPSASADLARANLGDPGGIDDFREAIVLATEAGQGRQVALLHNNLAYVLWAFEGPAASLEEAQAGIAFAQPRGLTEIVDVLTVGTLKSSGRHG